MGTKWITLNQASEEYNTDIRNILNWIKQKKIIGSKLGGVWFIDTNSVTNYLESNKTIKDYEEHLMKLIEDNDAYFENSTLKNLEKKFVVTSLEKISPFYELIIGELSFFIKDKKKKEIFHVLSTGKSIQEIANSNGMSYQKVCYLYKSAINIIIDKLGSIEEIRNNMAAVLSENRQLNIKCRSYEVENKRLQEMLELKYDVPATSVDMAVDSEIIKRLSLNFMRDFQLSTRVVNGLRASNIITIEDLLRFTKDNGFGMLLTLRNFGVNSLNELLDVLKHTEIIDENHNSELYDYVS